ncbi:unnamed protein product [Acanthoscelides obtectus]|uniref:Uncharacterized protein n=1 Tax=Acanthoscelides obtectus TaxID=200917 RepID=A0A9P0KIH8_ACAOB|nr:unnamed protein product [Acanthoscelides obtectus]CAK1631748.1 hypothetical protein AOBTE_LOCUS7130 [Acanthoscelides obtectus]
MLFCPLVIWRFDLYIYLIAAITINAVESIG